MADIRWYYRLGAEEKGPVSANQIDALIEAGIVTAHTQVWSEGIESWRPARMTELRTKFPGSISPPPFEAPLPLAVGSKSSSPRVRRVYANAGLLALTKYLFIAAALVAVGLAILFVKLKSVGAKLALAEADLQKSPLNLIVLTDMVISLACIAAFIVLIYRIARNAEHISGRPLDISPGWAVGWYFVPIAQFWMPYRATVEIAARSQGLETRTGDGGILGWWLLLLGSIALHVAGVIVIESDKVDGSVGHQGFYVLAAANIVHAFAANACRDMLTKIVLQQRAALSQREASK